MELSEESVLKALSYVDDPDLKKDIVSLKMVRDIRIEGRNLAFKVVLTTPACPMKDMIQRACVNAIHHFISPDIKVEAEMTADVTSGRNDVTILSAVKNIIAVASGKGGVGKSTVSANLAAALSIRGAKVGLLDADIYGPSIPLMFGAADEKPEMVHRNGKDFMIPVERHGIKLLSIGFLIPKGKAIVWRGPMLSSAFRQFVNDVAWDALDYLVIDLPPGTGDVHLTLTQSLPLSGVVIVTTPQEVAVADARKAMDMFSMPQLNIPILGVVENMAYFAPADNPGKKYHIFGQGGGERLANEFNTALLGQIPLVEKINSSGDDGMPVVFDTGSEESKAFMSIAENLARAIAVQNAGSLAQTASNA